MKNHGIEISIAGGGEEIVRGSSPRRPKAPFIPALPTTLTLVTDTYESHRAMTHNESYCEILPPDSYESYRYLINQSGAQSTSPGETHDSEL